MIHAEVEALYKAHGQYVYQRCRALLGDGDEAYDALQEVFVKVIRARPRFDDDRPILAWVNRVTTNHCLNRLRARRYRSHTSLEGRHTLLADSSPTAFLHRLYEQRDVVRRLLAATDERTQHVVVAYFFDEQPVERIGETLSISVPTVRRVMKRFLARARQKLVAEQQRLAHGEVIR